MKSILDKNFRYTPSAATDIRTTFRRLEREKAKAERDYALAWDEAHAENERRNIAERQSKVRQLGRKK